MSRLRDTLAIIASVAAVVAVFGLATFNDTVMGIAGIVAALAALGWGLIAEIQDYRGSRLRPKTWIDTT